MRDHSQHIQLSREDAVAATLAALDAQPEGFGWRGRAASADHAGKVERKLVERVSLAESVGRVLVYDVCAANDMPSAHVRHGLHCAALVRFCRPGRWRNA